MQKLRKGKYKVTNWQEYNESLKSRGDITFWIEENAIKNWEEDQTSHCTRGRSTKYSDLAIQIMYTIRQLFSLALRQMEGFVSSIFKLMKLKLPIPDYTTVSRRAQKLSINIVTSKPEGKIHLILDSTGIKVMGEKEWIKHKHGTKERKIWRKLHIGVTKDGNIVAGEVTTLRDSDIATVPSLLSQVHNEVKEITGDGAYYKKRMQKYMQRFKNLQNAKFLDPPKDKDHKYDNRLKVEETFSRYKRIIGNKFKAKNFLTQKTESAISLRILNKMFDIGKPNTIRIA